MKIGVCGKAVQKNDDNCTLGCLLSRFYNEAYHPPTAAQAQFQSTESANCKTQTIQEVVE